MTYPDPLYFGDNGEASATYRPAGTAPDLVHANGTRVHYLSTGASTGGLFGLYHWVMGPVPSGPGPHFHRSLSESFYILSGSIRIYDGDDWIDTAPGDWIHVPPGGVHGFRNESGAPAEMLIHFSPGAPREGYFEGVAHLGEMSEEEKAEFFLRHDNYWV
ncbi:cupin domain-containing protein [Nonomuraea longicatena]|uniref:Cupin domain-containing protein n=1 Tax=Nonomuraea longicatena TaxID=83682 RepID=A0ABP4A3B2_9ACTN